MVRVPTNREPKHPGEMLLEEFLKPMGVSQQERARAAAHGAQRSCLHALSQPHPGVGRRAATQHV
jgi:plasmid maintenance system antidote protein VapI